jgi:hypothetical protein
MTDSTPLSNTAEIDGQTKDGFANILRLDNAIDAAILHHVQELKDDRKEAWKTLGAKLDVPLKDLGLFYKLYRRQEESRSFEDDGEGAKVRDAHRQLFASLAKGETLDFVDVLTKVEVSFTPGGKRDAVFEGKEGAAPAIEENRPEDDTDNGLDGADPRTSGLLTKERGEGAHAVAAEKPLDENPYDGGTPQYLAWQVGFYRGEGAGALKADKALKDCPYPKNSEAAKDWRHGFQTESKAAGFEDPAPAPAEAAE